jgi:serine protease Do
MRKTAIAIVVVLAVVAGVVGFRDTLLMQARHLHPSLSDILSPHQPGAFAEVVRRVSPAVVTIQFVDAKTSQRGNGSGFIIDPEGHIVTNDHVVSGASKIEVLFGDGTRVPAEVVGRDQPTDLALIRVKVGRPLPHVRFGDDHKIEVGDWVLAIGSPDFKPGTVTAGILSAKGRDGVEGGSQFTSYLQIDAALNHGNSGGPTFNLSGEVIGVNVLASYNTIDPSTGMGERNDGLAFAIPASTAAVVVKGLRTGRFNRGLLGVGLAALSGEDALALGLKSRRGALVTSVVSGSPADKTGLRINDVVLLVDGEAVESELDCLRKISLLQPGQTATFTIWRDKAEMEFRITVVSRDTLAQRPPLPAQPAAVEFASIGASLRETPVARMPSHSDRGVFVDQVAARVAASGSVLRRGDRITAIGATPVNSLSDVTAALAAAAAQGNAGVIVYVETPLGGQRHVAVRLKTPE